MCSCCEEHELGAGDLRMRQRTFSRAVLNYADYVLTEYPRDKKSLQIQESSVTESAMNRNDEAMMKLGQVGYLSARPVSDPTGESAARLDGNRQIQQLRVQIAAVEELLENCTADEQKFIQRYFWDGVWSHSVEEKRLHRIFCMRMAVVLGFTPR